MRGKQVVVEHCGDQAFGVQVPMMLDDIQVVGATQCGQLSKAGGRWLALHARACIDVGHACVRFGWRCWYAYLAVFPATGQRKVDPAAAIFQCRGGESQVSTRQVSAKLQRASFAEVALGCFSSNWR